MNRESAWDHGYPTSSSYTCGFYRELAPNWLDFAALVKGLRPPRPSGGAPFRYLDLGSGMGYGLCLLAALYPEGEFLGIDFHPDHQAHADDLRRRLDLPNLRFQEGDFLELATDHAPLGQFNYVVSHGIASWVVPPVQQALLALAAAVLAPGGLFYCSINTLPGWLAGSVFHTLASLELRRGDASEPLVSLTRAADTLRQLLGPEAQPSALALSLPNLREHLARLHSVSSTYLSQEYACSGWRPLYAAEFHELCQQHKLRHVATATLPELGDDLLPESLRATVLKEPNPLIRETLLDLATNKSFRRDLFMRGRVTLTPAERELALHGLTLRLQEAPPLDTYAFTTSFGGVTGNPDLYRPLEAALAAGPRSLAQLSSALNRELPEILGMALLLLHAGRIGLDRGAAGEKALAGCSRVRAVVQELVMAGQPYEFLPAPAVGSAASFSLVETLVASALADGLEPDLAAPCVHLGLQELGRRLNDHDGRPYDDPEQEFEALVVIAERLRTTRLPSLRELGVFQAHGSKAARTPRARG